MPIPTPPESLNPIPAVPQSQPQVPGLQQAQQAPITPFNQTGFVIQPTQQVLVQKPITFDDAYWASQPPAVQQLRKVTDPGAKLFLADELAQAGYLIDVPIMVWGYDPETTMKLRASFGYTWVPSALMQPPQIAPGLAQGGVTPYNPNVIPNGAIKVSTNIADYPPFHG